MRQAKGTIEQSIKNLCRIVQHMLKKTFFRRALLARRISEQQILSFVNLLNQNKMNQSLNADKFEYDKGVNTIKDDKQIQPQKTCFNNVPVKSSTDQGWQQSRSAIKRDCKSTHSSFNSRNNSEMPSTNTLPEFSANPIPLWVYDSQIPHLEVDEMQEQQFANLVRERKTKRELFKTKLIEVQQAKLQPPMKYTNRKSNSKAKNKKDKFNYFQHFVEMETNFQEKEGPLNSDKENNEQRLFLTAFNHKKESQSLHVSPVKAFSKNLAFTTRKWEPLVVQERQFALQSPQQMKLSPGVTVRQSTNKLNGVVNASFIGNSTNRKRIQMLKNNQGNPIRLNFNELMSYKRLGSMTHLAYCSSLKTVKDFKESTETNISIDSRQLVSEQNLSKRLIKIANRRVYDELLIQENQAAAMGRDKNRNKLRIKKQGKVRFHNVAQI